ncbi:C2H2 domain-containing protein, partial [Bimuria novae-zelandiae CBS 107.79]
MNGNNSVQSLPPSQVSRTSTGALSQQSTLVGGPGSEALRAAVLKFKARLSGTELTNFKDTTYETLCDELMRLQYEQEHTKTMANLGRIQSFLEAMHQFSKTIEIFLNVSDVVAFVWGPIKFLLLTASTLSESFETLLDAYSQIGEHLPLLQEYESLFNENPYMIQALELMYIDILDFHQQSMKFFSGSRWRKFFRAMWKDFDTKFSGILKRLARHKDVVECRATISQYRTYRENMAEMKAKLDEMIAEERAKKLSAVKEWLAVGSIQEEDHAKFTEIRLSYQDTGKWIMKNDNIKDWIDADVPTTPIVWLNGMPGAGKTILASTIVDECSKRNTCITSYFYCHYEGQRCNTAVGVLKGLIHQLLSRYPDLVPPCHAKKSKSGEPVLRSFILAKIVFEDFCSIPDKIFIVIDGLDECEQYERKQLLEFLVDIVTQCDTNDPGKLRVMIVSQDYPDIKRALHTSSTSKIVPKIVSMSAADNENDISSFVRIWVDRIAAKHELFDEEAKEYLRNLTVERAKGMFLYAKLVMENLHQQPTRGDLLDSISTNNFPDSLKDAYERIVTRIKRTFKVEWPIAKKLLGWMVCAQRQLTWREIQVALSIDVDNRSIEYNDRRLRGHIYDICGSLVTVSGHRVSLVHSTARYYLTKSTEDIHQPSVECELTTLCLQYLTFPCFQTKEPVEKQELRQMMLEGQFAFQDYAVAKWFQHVNAFVNTGKDLLEDYSRTEELVRDVSMAIDAFMDQYHDEDFHESKKIVAECRENCSAFESQEFYDDIVALTSHIYTFQKKGFEARHKVSIKSLEEALNRNRKFMEETVSKLKGQELEIFKEFYDHERPYKCTKITCMYFSEGFKDAKSKKRHVNVHERPFQCEVTDCLGNEGFSNHKDLEKHTRSFHPEISDLAERFNTTHVTKTKATHTCHLCGKSFTRKLILDDHVKSHKGIRSEECEECGKAFTRKNDLRRHQKIHERG